jgi:lysophospholipid acyltransferase (LPLAT)-like uncharacterized protein
VSGAVEALRGEAKRRLVAGLGGGALTALLGTVRWTIRGREHYDRWWGSRRPVVFALWHGRLLPCSYYHRGQDLATLISQHRDGDYIAGVVEGWWGYRAVRGSSSRGGTAALRGIVKVLREGSAMAITPDGPRGPRQRMKPGLLVAAQLAGVPVIPVSAGASRAWWIEGWDRFLIPKPFSHVVMEYSEPVEIPRSAGEAEVEAISAEIEARLNEMTTRIDAELAS